MIVLVQGPGTLVGGIALGEVWPDGDSVVGALKRCGQAGTPWAREGNQRVPNSRTLLQLVSPGRRIRCEFTLSSGHLPYCMADLSHWCLFARRGDYRTGLIFDLVQVIVAGHDLILVTSRRPDILSSLVDQFRNLSLLRLLHVRRF